MILPRLITAIVGVPLILITIKFGGIPYFILIAGIVLLVMYVKRMKDTGTSGAMVG